MSNREQVQEVQQQVENVLRKASEMEGSLARKEQAGDQEAVQYLRNQLEQLYKERVALREKENLLLRAQQGGGTGSDADANVARMRKILQETAFINQWHEQRKGWPWVLIWWPGIWLGHWTFPYLPASIVRVNCLGYAVLGACLVCAFPAGFVSPTFSAGIVASLTACLITGSNYRRDHVLKEDAMALEKHHRSLEEYVQFLETFDVDQQGSTTFSPEELHNAASQLSKARTLLDLTKARLEQKPVS